MKRIALVVLAACAAVYVADVSAWADGIVYGRGPNGKIYEAVTPDGGPLGVVVYGGSVTAAPASTPTAVTGSDGGNVGVAPRPGSLKNPSKLTLAGAAFTCAQIKRTDGGSNPGQCLRISCSVDCEYNFGVYLSDGGIDVGDGTYNANADSNQLPAATPEQRCEGSTEDGICVYSASAGSAYAAQVK